MIPAFKACDVKPVRPTKEARARTLEIITKAIKADEDYKRICKENGIPYIPCVAATPHPMAKYSR